MTTLPPAPPFDGDFPRDFPSDAVLTRLMGLHPKLIDLSLDRTLDLLDRLGRPQDRLPPVVHVAGTNGKGSAIAALRAIVEAAGYRAHVYTSPHLTRFHERIRLAGTLIEEPSLLDLLERCERANENRPITFFEITTCAALKAFSETPADLVLLETGMGGRLDSTNVVARPAATLITPVSMDHMQFLGDTIEKIAAEKAAIQKPGTPSVVGPQDPAAMRVIADHGRRVGAPLARCDVEWSAAPDPDGGFRFTSDAWSGRLPAPNLAGAHQRRNVANAVATALVLRDQGFDIPDTALAAGIRQIDWPARLQPLTRGPIPAALPGWEVVLDGGHNAAAGEALAEELARRAAADGRPVTTICGMMNTKAALDFLRPLAPHLAHFRAIAIPGEENSFSAQDLAAMAREAGLPDVAPAADIDAALSAIAPTSTPAANPAPALPGRLVICGSLYLAGRVLRANG